MNRQVQGCRRLSVFGALLDFPTDVPDCVDLLVTDATEVFAHGLCPVSSMTRLVELCAGVACSSTGLSFAGFTHVASLEWKGPFVQLHRSLHPGIPVIEGDVNDPASIAALLKQVEPPFCMMSGIACQPYSSGGSQQGSEDVRSNTLPATLRACHLCQCPVLVIECVTQARSNKFVRSQVQMLEQLGYCLSEVSLKLEDQWAAHRFRWWLVASHKSIGSVPLPEWPKSPVLNVRDLMPFVKQWPPEVMQELQLTQHEIQQFTLDGSSLRRYVVQTESKLPTCLHSWGSQATACPCGCRGQFSDHLIQQRGIYAQLLPVPVAEGSPVYRHLHPCELALLNAMPPPSEWMSAEHPSLKLCLAAIGQLASPLQSLWVGACVMKQIHHMTNQVAVNPQQLLQEFKHGLFAFAREMFPNVAKVAPAEQFVRLQYPDGTEVKALVQAHSTLEDLCRAEASLTLQDMKGTWIDGLTGNPLAVSDCVAGRTLTVGLPNVSPARSSADVMDLDPPASPASAANPLVPSGLVPAEETMHVPVDTRPAEVIPDMLSGLLTLSGLQLASLIPPLVSELQTGVMLRSTGARLSSRLTILRNEGPAMGDDELSLHVTSLIRMSGRSDVGFLDPLLATGWLQTGTPEKVQTWLAQPPGVTTIVSVVFSDGHWIPVMRADGLTDVHVSIWEFQDTSVDFLCPLHGVISQAWGKPMFSVACSRRVFAKAYCGSAAVAFFAHHLLNRDLPASEDDVRDLHLDLKMSFEAALQAADFIQKPWCWGLGQPDVHVLVGALLQTHGVPSAQVALRAKLVLQSLGKSEVLKAVSGSSPWKSLKALANLHSPPIRLVLPDELLQQSTAKQGAKSKKPASDAKRLQPTKPADLDPAKLLIEPGSFCLADDTPVAQIQFSALGPLTSGIALASFQEAQPFLQSGQRVTNLGLALLILNPPMDFHTGLQWATIRFAARCSANHEPMLLTGVLVQLGGALVTQFRAKDTPAILAVDVACARITVFKDQWEGSWEDFAAKPVKHILQKLPALHTCRAGQDCSCSSWHPTEAQPHDALLDVFRRQFVTEAGRPVKWDQAHMFGVMVRFDKSLEMQVLGLSGQHGIYIEPKTEDAQKPSSDYQVVWLPQLDFQAASHKAKCEVHCIGLARTGRRYGLRVHVKHFQSAFVSAKPEAVFLAPGSRRTFTCGPWPYGSDRKNIAKVLRDGGWECRPLQPAQHVPGGLMWSIQAVLDPPSSVLSMQHGQVVISCADAKPDMPDPSLQIVGQPQTVKMCLASDTAGVDPWLTTDPW